MYSLLDLCASSPDPADLKTGCQSFRFGTGTELSHLMRDRVEFWLKMGLHPLLSQRSCYVRQVIWSHRTPADLRWIIVNLKSNSGTHICGLLRWHEDTRTAGWEDGLGRLNWNSMKVDGEVSLLLCCCGIIRLTVLCVWLPLLLLLSLPPPQLPP